MAKNSDCCMTLQGNLKTKNYDLKTVIPGIKYSSFILEDGKTFLHFGIYADQEALEVVNNLPSFQSFREQLKASEPEIPPKGDDLSLVDSSYEIF